MVILRRSSIGAWESGRGWRGGLSALLVASLLAVVITGRPGLGRESGPKPSTYYYSTAEAPRDYQGPRPSTIVLAMNDGSSAAGELDRVLDREIQRASAPTGEEKS